MFVALILQYYPVQPADLIIRKMIEDPAVEQFPRQIY